MVMGSLRDSFIIAGVYFALVLVERFFIYRKVEFNKFGDFLLISLVLVVPIAFLYTFMANYFLPQNFKLALLAAISVALIGSAIFAFGGVIDFLFIRLNFSDPNIRLKLMYILFHVSVAVFYLGNAYFNKLGV